MKTGAGCPGTGGTVIVTPPRFGWYLVIYIKKTQKHVKTATHSKLI
jgi:hypothetical protein